MGFKIGQLESECCGGCQFYDVNHDPCTTQSHIIDMHWPSPGSIFAEIGTTKLSSIFPTSTAGFNLCNLRLELFVLSLVPGNNAITCLALCDVPLLCYLGHKLSKLLPLKLDSCFALCSWRTLSSS